MAVSSQGNYHRTPVRGHVHQTSHSPWPEKQQQLWTSSCSQGTGPCAHKHLVCIPELSEQICVMAFSCHKFALDAAIAATC